MSKKVEDIDVRNCTYYFFNDISNIKKFDPNKRLGRENGQVLFFGKPSVGKINISLTILVVFQPRRFRKTR